MCDQFEKENPTFVQDQQAIEAAQKAAAEAAKKAEPMEATSRCPEPGTLPAVATAKAPEGVDSMGAIGDILRKEKMKEALTTMFTPEQLAQNVADAEYKKTPSYQVQQELLHIKHRTLEMQGMAEAQKNTPEWRKELMDLHQAHERLGVFDPEWRERQAIAGAAGMIGSLAAVAPQLTYRMALGHFAGKAMTEGLLHSAQTESDVAMAHLVGFCVDLAVGSHMPAGGLIARGAALTTKAATAESGGVLNRLREAGKDLAQWRPDPHAMGSGFVPLTRKAPAAATTALETATGKTTVAEAGVSEAPLSIHGNDLRSKKPNHIYKITEDGVTYKFGESGQGLKKRDGLSKRAEQQVRKLRKADPDSHYESKILRTYPDKATAKKFETKIIEKRILQG